MIYRSIYLSIYLSNDPAISQPVKETEEEEISPRLPLFATLSHSFARGSLLLLEPLLLLAGEVCLKGDKRSCDAATSDLHIPLPLAKKKKKDNDDGAPHRCHRSPWPLCPA